MADGASDESIRNVLIQSYGARVLLTPPAEGFASLVWILPVVLFVGGSAVVAAAASRRPNRDRAASDADRELVERARRELSDEGSGVQP